MKNKSILVTSMFALLMSASLVAGATYSLFTSESKHNITVSSGKVVMDATIDPANFVYKSGLEQKTFNGGFENGGTASYDAETSTLALTNLTPLDTLEFKIVLDNQSTVASKYRVKINCTDGYDLYGALRVSDIATSWKYIAPEEQPNDIEASIALPDVGNDYQNKTTKLNVVVEAIQGNAETPEDNVVPVQTSTGTAKLESAEASSVTVTTDNGAAKVTVPNSKITNKEQDVTLKVEKDDKNTGNFEINEATENAVFYNINVENATHTNAGTYKVELFVGKGLKDVKVLHKADGKNPEPVANTNYNTNTGYVSFETSSFSPYAVIAAKNSVKNGSELLEAIKAAEDNTTIELTETDYYLNSELASSNKVTLKGTNGKQNVIIGLSNDKLNLENITFDNVSVKTSTDGLLTTGTYTNIRNYDAFVRHSVERENTVLVGTKENFKLNSIVSIFTPDDPDSQTLTATLKGDVTFIPKNSEGSKLRPYINLDEGFKDFTLDMAGNKFSYAFTDESFKGVPAFFSITNAINVTIKNGIIDAELGNNSSYGVNLNNKDCSLTVESTEFYGAPTAFQVQAGTLNVMGGHFDMSTSCKAAAPAMSKYVINCIDASFKNKTAKINVTGGTFVNFNPSKDPEGAGTTYVAEGYKVVSETHGSETWYTVVQDTQPTA